MDADKGANRQHHKFLYPIAFFLGLLLACRTADTLAPQPPVESRPSISSNQALLDAAEVKVGYSPAGLTEQEVQVNDFHTVSNGDGVNVYNPGVARLHFADWWQLTIFHDTQLIMKEINSALVATGTTTTQKPQFVIDPDAPPVVVVLLAAGTIWQEDDNPKYSLIEIKNNSECFGLLSSCRPVEIQPNGTKFLVHYAPDIEAVWVVVKEGQVAVTAASQTVIVSAQFQTAVFGSGPPLPPVPASRPVIRNIFPLVDDLTSGIARISDAFVLDNAQCFLKDTANFYDLWDGTGTKIVDTLPAGAPFAAAWRSVDSVWVAGVNPQTSVIGWVLTEVLDCGFPLTLLADTGKMLEWNSQQPASHENLVNALLQGERPTAKSELIITPTPELQVNAAQVYAPTAEQNMTCPGELQFAGTIYATGTGTATYQWESNDSTSDVRTVSFNGEEKLDVNWQKSVTESYEGWARLHLLTPIDTVYPETYFKINCVLPPANFAGVWYSTIGTMELNQEGNSVTGKYSFPALQTEGNIQGTVTGATLAGTIEGNSTSYPFQWTLNGLTFDALFDGWLPVCGARAGNAFLAGCGFAGQWITSMPGIETCLVDLTIVDLVVSGTYCNGDLTGDISYDTFVVILKGTWLSSSTGSFAFKLPLADKAFSGNGDGTYPWCGWRVDSSAPDPCLWPQPEVAPIVPSSLEVSAISAGSYGGYSSVCPLTLTFEGQVNVSGVGNVIYAWEFSDGYLADKKTVSFNGESMQGVKFDRQFSSSYDGWVVLHVFEPQELWSDKAVFTLSCQPVLSINDVKIDMNRSSERCPTTYNFNGTIYAAGAGPVTYRWELSDGVWNTEETVYFNGEGKQPVKELSWPLSDSYQGWVRLHLLGPIDVSYDVPFTLVCEPPAADFSGDWTVNEGKLNLQQSGSTVSGTLFREVEPFEYTIYGTVVGNVLNATLTNAQDSSDYQSLRLEMAPYDKTVDGVMSMNSGATTEFCGTRPGVEFPNGCSFAGEWITTRPGYKDCPLTIARVDNSIFGRDCAGPIGGDIRRSGEGEVLEGYTLDPKKIPFQFFLNSEGTQFQGNYAGMKGWCGWRTNYAVPDPCMRLPK